MIRVHLLRLTYKLVAKALHQLPLFVKQSDSSLQLVLPFLELSLMCMERTVNRTPSMVRKYLVVDCENVVGERTRRTTSRKIMVGMMPEA